VAAVRLGWCERCGKKKPGLQHAIPMRTGIWALVCDKCANRINWIFLNKPRTELRTVVMFPALDERTKAG